MDLDKLLMAHPRDIGESYGEHAGHAAYIGTRMIGAGFACLVHALLPGLFVRTASRTVTDIQGMMTARATTTRLDEQTA
ncbi:MAG TPA: DUF6356 family protein [Pseudomonadales bacterium]